MIGGGRRQTWTCFQGDAPLEQQLGAWDNGVVDLRSSQETILAGVP